MEQRFIFNASSKYRTGSTILGVKATVTGFYPDKSNHAMPCPLTSRFAETSEHVPRERTSYLARNDTDTVILSRTSRFTNDEEREAGRQILRKCL